MIFEQRTWTQSDGWSVRGAEAPAGEPSLLLVFGAVEALRKASLATLRRDYPAAELIGCSTAGEIHGSTVTDDSIVATAVQFRHTPLRSAHVTLTDMSGSFAAGERLARALPATVPQAGASTHARMTHVFVLSDGLHVNGSDLVRGLVQQLPVGVTITGGLAGDGARFQETLVLAGDVMAPGTIAAVAFYGERLQVGFGSLGGWDPFGPERVITRSQGNVLYELDGRSALGLYERYLGSHARELPAAGLLFPLSLRSRAGEQAVVRTILAIDREAQSLTFAGDVPEGSYARLMKANFDRLIDGAVGAAQTSYRAIGSTSPALAILISCVGRKLVLKQRVEEEVEGAREVLGAKTVFAGFYSYGEISPFTPGARCELHNQTMTITTLSET